MTEQTGLAEELEEQLGGRNPWRRLFLDAMVTEESDNLTRVFHSAQRHPANPVLRHEKPWESMGVCVGGTVMWLNGKLTMRYKCYGPDGADACLAESSDGIYWERPNMGLVEYHGSTENNIIPGGTSSIIRVRKPRSSRELWAQYSYGGDGTARVTFSEDAIHWRREEARTGLFTTSDVTNFFYDPFGERYVATYKCPNRRHRSVGIALSKDGLDWHKPVEGAVFGADDLDPDATQIYGMPVFPYQGIYIGIPWIYHARWMKYGLYDSPQKMYEAQVGSPCTMDVQLAWSWDLISWNRTPERRPFIGLGPAGGWEWGMILTARAPVIMGDELYFYYYGCDNIHDVKDVRCDIGLATLRLDGFCSMSASDEEGWLISRREVFSTPRIAINAKTQPDGYVVAELLDRNNHVIEGFSRSECVPFCGDSVRHELSWKTAAFALDLIEPDKKVRFHLRKADFYSYLPIDVDTERDQGSRRAQ